MSFISLSYSAPPRVVVDPNSVSRDDPTLSLAMFDDADRVPSEGELVYAVQPDDDGTEAGTFARVVRINSQHRLIYLRVDWHGFEEHDASHVRWAGGALGAQADVYFSGKVMLPRLDAESFTVTGSDDSVISDLRIAVPA